MSIQDHKTIFFDVLVKAGLPVTLKLIGMSLLLALLIGITLGIVRSFKLPVIDRICGLYAQICRGVPDIIVLLFLFATVSFSGAYWTSVLAISITQGAYMMEIVKGGLLSIDRGQWEAAKSLSLPLPTTLARIIFPQVLLVTLPAIIGQMVMLVKATSVASTIGCLEITRKAILLLPVYANPLVIYGYVLIIFFVICHLLTMLGRKLEKSVVRKIMGEMS